MCAACFDIFLSASSAWSLTMSSVRLLLAADLRVFLLVECLVEALEDVFSFSAWEEES